MGVLLQTLVFTCPDGHEWRVALARYDFRIKPCAECGKPMRVVRAGDPWDVTAKHPESPSAR